MSTVPKQGEFYRHFKNRMYQILAVATHSETGEKMVVYQALYGDFGVWVRPLAMFMEPVDHEKYPDVRQEYRFERVIPGASCPQDDELEIFSLDEDERQYEEQHKVQYERQQEEQQEEQGQVSPLLLEFLDTDSLEEKMAILHRMKGKVGPREVESLCLCLDTRASGGSVEEQLESLRQYLGMQKRYDASRLRRG